MKQTSNGKSNIIFILTDDLGYADVACYGQKNIQTPNIDHLATEGISFTQCYAGATICAPSRNVLMTGQHTGHTRVRGNFGIIGGRFQQAVRIDDWKGLRLGQKEPLELYDLSNDIGEQHNLSAQHPEVVEKIEDYLKTARTESRNWPTPENR